MVYWEQHCMMYITYIYHNLTKDLNTFDKSCQQLLSTCKRQACHCVLCLGVKIFCDIQYFDWSSCLKILSRHLLLNYWIDLLQIFRNYFLGSLDLHVLLFVSPSVISIFCPKFLSEHFLLKYWMKLLLILRHTQTKLL